MADELLPLLIQHDPSDGGILARIEGERTELSKALTARGALLFRGFDVDGVDGFDQMVRTLAGPPLTYAERSSPRSAIKGQVYTSTDYPPTEEIFLHNENSYQANWPNTLFFYCLEPPTRRGATPLADVREVYDLIDPAVRDEFARRRWMVVRNFHSYFGQTWQYVFGTEDRTKVERYCRANGIDVEWRDDGLRTRAVRDAVHRHPVSGEKVWFNHATFFHISTLAPDVQNGLRGTFRDEDLPTNTFFGDGAPIGDDVMAHLRECYRTVTARFDYRRDDVLVIDNMLTAHGREPFSGQRKIAVAMADRDYLT